MTTNCFDLCTHTITIRTKQNQLRVLRTVTQNQTAPPAPSSPPPPSNGPELHNLDSEP